MSPKWERDVSEAFRRVVFEHGQVVSQRKSTPFSTSVGTELPATCHHGYVPGTADTSAMWDASTQVGLPLSNVLGFPTRRQTLTMPI